jgi:hypothetical protein
MKYISLWIILFSLSCTPQQENKHAVVEESSALKALVRGEDLALALNNGSRWVLDSISLNTLYTVRREVYDIGFNLEKVKLGQLNRFGVDLQAYIDSMPKTLGEHRHPQLEILLLACEQQIELLRGNDLQKAQTAVVSLSNILDEVNKFFVYPGSGG